MPLRHDEELPVCTVYALLPPVPGPRSSPATSTSIVPDRTFGVQLNPVPSFVTLVIVPWGMANDSPPGITPLNWAVLDMFDMRH